MIGRAFTPLQHHHLVQQLDEFIQEDTELLVMPNITDLYNDGQIQEWEAKQLFQEMWDKILKIQKNHGLKVLTSVSKGSSLEYAVIGDSDNKIEVEDTVQGWKYSSSDFEQMCYRRNGFVQTTIPYWQRKTSKTVVRVEKA